MKLFVHTVIAGGLLLGSPLPAAAQSTEPLFQTVPREHWAYAALDGVERAGLPTGFPEGSFRERQSHTRYELAQAVERVLREVYRGLANVECGDDEQRLRGAVLQKQFLDHRPKSSDLSRLAAEFGSELKLLGASFEGLERTIQRLDHIPPPAPTTSLNRSRSADYTRGMMIARQEWANRAVTLVSYRPEPRLQIDTDLGLPVRHFAPADPDAQSARDYVAGHNEEIYRLLLRHGLPPDNLRRWLRQIADPASAWSAGGRRAQVGAGSPTTTVPGSTLTVQLCTDRQAGAYRLEIADAAGVPFRVALSDLDPGARRIEILRGPIRSHLLFVRWRLPGRDANCRYLVLDTRQGLTLNERDLPDPAEVEYSPAPSAPL